MEQTIRLDKYLADMGKGSRAQIKEAVRKGRIMVNGMTAKDPGMRVTASADHVKMDGEDITYALTEYYMLNKPQGVVSATEDARYRTVVDLITGRKRKDLFPVGRLDLDTEGLLLITNDGGLAHRLLAPGKHVDKVYYAECQGRVPKAAVDDFARGIRLPDGLSCLPAKLELLSVTGTEAAAVSKVLLTLREGKFHQVKRMMEAAGCPVTYLKRITMGPLSLDESLLPGQYRPLTEEETEQLKQL